MNSVSKIIIGIIGAIFGAVVIGLIVGFIIGPIDTGNSNFTEAISEIGILLNQPEESEMLFENESYTESANDSGANSGTGIGNIVRSRIASTTRNDTDNNTNDAEIEDDVEDDITIPPHPIVGSWETTVLAEVDTDITGSIAEIRHFFEDGTGVEYHNESTQRREFAWRIENNRLRIAPSDTSFMITTNSFEVSDNTLTIFYNTNRTSFSEAERMLNSDFEFRN